MKNGLVILHIDGLSARYLQEAIDKNKMPFTKKLIEKERYTIKSYRCGLPSTTPHSQAGILYGNNDNIPSFRWFDKKSGMEVKFGVGSTFKYVAHKYFKNTFPIIEKGAAIAACFPAGAKQTYGLAYKDRKFEDEKTSRAARMPIILRWVLNPLHLIDWLWHSLAVVIKMLLEFLRVKITGQSITLKYLLSDLLEEIFVHHLTRYATGLAMKDGYKSIYSCIYAYDETAHAFSPNDTFCLRILKEIDRTISYIARRRNRHNLSYQLVILSDHGQVATIPFTKFSKRKMAEIVADLLPTYVVNDGYGTYHKNGDAVDGHIQVENSGGISHIYFTNNSSRLNYSEIIKQFPGFIHSLAQNPNVEFVMAKEKNSTVLIKNNKKYSFKNRIDADTKHLLSKLEDPNILAAQLAKLNSFSTSGDVVIFGAWRGNKQINFENQSGGHGSIGGEQLFPFILTKKEWNVNTDKVTDAVGVHSIIKKLQRRFKI